MDNFWENKKVVAYIALAHHTRFITPIMEELSSRGARVQYIVGQAENSQEITAIELGLEYSHIFDYTTDEDANDIQKNYALLKQTFGCSLKNNFLLGSQPVTVTDKTLFATAVEYIGFKNLLDKEKPDLCFALHEINRWGKMFAFWAKKKNCPFITLQEGMAYTLDFGHSGSAQYSTLNLVWGEKAKKKLVSFEAPASKIIPVGNTHLATEIAYQKEHGIREIKRNEYHISDKFVSLLILSSILPDPNLFKPIFKVVSENKDQRIFVKFHPSCRKEHIDNWAKIITTQYKNNSYFIHAQENTYNLLSMADICILGQQSTVGLEAIAFGKPLIKMNFAYKKNAPNSFVDNGVAVKMSADRLAFNLLEKKDFSKFIDKKKIDQYLNQELSETTESISKICRILKKTVLAHTSISNVMGGLDQPLDKKWSFIIQVPDDHDIFLAQLETIAVNSENQGDYELLLLEPEKKSKEMIKVLESLKGDLIRIIIPKGKNPISILNKAAQDARGENLIFLEKNLAPLKGWLACLSNAFKKHESHNIFGARISSKNGKIANAGVIADQNNTPVCAYRHLNMDFPSALKERSFQMTDYFIAMKKDLFLNTGGFTPEAGAYLFLDICLKTLQYTNDPNAIVYLPEVKMIFLDKRNKRDNMDDSVYFYGRWNSYIWESEKKLYQEDGVSPQDLVQATLSSAAQSII